MSYPSMFASQFDVDAEIFTRTFWLSAPTFGVANDSDMLNAAANRFW